MSDFEKDFQELMDNDDILCDHCLRRYAWCEIEELPENIIVNILKDNEYFFVCEYCKGRHSDDYEYWENWVEKQRKGDTLKDITPLRKRIAEEGKRRRELITKDDEYWIEFKERHKKIKKEFNNKEN
ncbi:hypothetical protein [Cytobacillus sp. IB215316]|uniref:hypothetical protein n=1 Tax=Cytobacillus sp. IB215316 TaxID=3097354 RepID=UPI002A118D32|nr:hypothetical protein [Cytobacillus sp. IB215316]MDX8359842.1 hypothetical protein [Cytobacillus sp. IB215316]